MFGIPLAPLITVFAGLMDFAIVAALYLYLESMKKKCGEVRRKWPQAKATILSSHLDQKTGSEGTLYSPVVRYRYTVDGRSYQSDRLSVYPRWSSSNRAPHQEFVARFPRDREVDIWVNPRDPADAVLTIDGPSGNALRLVLILLSAAGFVTIAIGIGFWIFRPHFPA